MRTQYLGLRAPNFILNCVAASVAQLRLRVFFAPFSKQNLSALGHKNESA
jgi:hypothetical protein